MQLTSDNSSLKFMNKNEGFVRCNTELLKALEVFTFLPKINHEELHFMLLGIYQLK